MDGLSGAASVVAILQLLESVVRLVEFGKSVRDAPANIKALFNDLDLLSQVLKQTQNAASMMQVEGTIGPTLRDCEEKIAQFHAKLSSATSHLNSDSFRRRTWSSLKSALKSNEIVQLRQSITDTKSTLTLALQSSLLHCVASSMKESQGQTFTQTQHISLSIEQLPSTTSDENIMQLPALEFQETETSRVALFNPSPNSRPFDAIEKGKSSPLHIDLKALAEGQSDVQEDVPPRPTRKARNRLSSWEKMVITPLVRIATCSTTFEISETGVDETRKKIEIEQRSILYPTRCGKFLGISQGMLVTARSTVGWQYTLQPFRAVPENALIFDLCRIGNLDGVRLLLARGEASPLDRDPMGRTPLWVAARSLKLDVAELLLREGADPHAQDWEIKHKPIAAVAWSEGVDMKPKLLMIDLLHQRRRDDYEDYSLMYMLGIFFLKYRPQTDIGMSWEQKRLEVLAAMRALLRTFPSGDEGDINRVKILFASVQFYFAGDVLRYVLNGIRGQIDWAESVIHEAILKRLLERDPESMRMIIQKTKNIHLLTVSRIPMAPHTPTMLAMYDPSLFIVWRTMLQDLGHDVREFVRQELEQGTLRAAGWTESSLLHLFQTDLTTDQYDGPRVFGFPICERCGHNGTCLGSRLNVDLGWWRHLRAIRKQYANTPSTNSIQEPQSLNIFVDRRDKWGGRSVNCWSTSTQALGDRSFKHLPYRIVCSTDCIDGVCVAWMYENDLDIEPSFPPYPQEPNAAGGLDDGKNSGGKEDEYPEVKVPGSFVD